MLENVRERDRSEDLGMVRILKWTLNKWPGRARYEFMQLRTGTNGWLLRTQ
jgi:hypothetical protein